MLFILLIILFPPSTLGQDFTNITAMFGSSPRRDLNFTQMLDYDGYQGEVHYVTTSDGYILTVFRVLPNANCTEDAKRLPIIFVHGLYLSADVCVLPGAGNKSHCYIYSNACYEVWVPNCRGNKYSRNHTRLDPDKDARFWDFDFEDSAMMDLAAVIDYVLEKTGQTQVIYIAHSEGATKLLVLCSKYPEYNAKIYIGFGMSTATWLEHSRLLVLPVEGLLAPVLTILDEKGVYAEVFKYDGFIQRTAKASCGLTTLSYPACCFLLFVIFGYNQFQLTPEVMINAVGHEPSGTSMKNFKRWGDVYNLGFRERNHGALLNLKYYGTSVPPEYCLDKVTMNWEFISSTNDYVSHPLDMQHLESKLVNCKHRNCQLDDQYFGHVDYIFGRDLQPYCADYILSVLNGGGQCKGTVHSNW